MSKAGLLWVMSLVLAGGCPGDAASADGQVHPGQRWRFRLGSLGEQVYEVTAVTASDVHYRVVTSADGVALGDPLEQRFPLAPSPGPFETGEAGAPLVAGGLRLDTWITARGGDRVTTAVSGRAPRFPGVLRVERGDEVIFELMDVKE